jgi:hypothetical protein
MSRVRVHNFAVSLDGFGTGECGSDESVSSPSGVTHVIGTRR